MKIDIVNPLPMQWEEGYKKVFPDAKWFKSSFDFMDDGDIKIFMWCNNDAVDYINSSGHLSKIVLFVRRYEFFTDCIERMNWKNVDAVICVNDYLADWVVQRGGIKPYVVYNGVSLDKWTYKERKPNKKIAWVGFINQKKNIPIALQIMYELPRDYELHIAGDIQDYTPMVYMMNLAEQMRLTVIHYNHIPHEQMDEWLDDKGYILNTSISEGCPNSVIEAMAKGIKPIVHNWPGAMEQFEDAVFNTVSGAVKMLRDNVYDSSEYRRIVREKFGFDNYTKVKEIVEGLWT